MQQEISEEEMEELNKIALIRYGIPFVDLCSSRQETIIQLHAYKLHERQENDTL